MSVAASSLWIVVMQVGMWLGYVSFGFISDALGPKKTYVGYLLVAAGLVPLYSRAGAASLLVLGPLVAFFGAGHFTGFGILTAELFPTSFRASAMGLTYNFGRALSAAAPWAIGVRPNSPPQITSVSSSSPRCFRSLTRAADAWSVFRQFF